MPLPERVLAVAAALDRDAISRGGEAGVALRGFSVWLRSMIGAGEEQGMPGFKFNLGDLVMVKISIVEVAVSARGGGFAVPPTYMVVERLMQECAGGTQLHYTCSRLGEAKRFHEEELVLRSEYDDQAHLDAWLAGRRKVNEATNLFRWGPGAPKEGE